MAFCQIAMFLSFLSGFYVPYVAQQFDLGSSFLLGALVCIFSMFSAIGLVILDKSADKYD
jgi:hypothetical protein